MRSRYAAAVILAGGEGVNSCMNPAAATEKKRRSPLCDRRNFLILFFPFLFPPHMVSFSPFFPIYISYGKARFALGIRKFKKQQQK